MDSCLTETSSAQVAGMTINRDIFILLRTIFRVTDE